LSRISDTRAGYRAPELNGITGLSQAYHAMMGCGTYVPHPQW
jgi:hypothetical protein